MMIAMDPPRQPKLRRLVLRAFTPRRVATMEPQVRALARRYLEPLLARGHGDFVEEVAAPLPMDVVSAMIGVPEEDRALLRGWVDALLHREDGRAEIPRAGLEGSANLVRYFADDLARRRRVPGDDLVSALLDAEVDGERLADDEIVGFCFLLVIAGIETTTKLLGNALVLLARHPDQRAFLAARPEGIADAVEEVLRYDTSTQMLARVLTRDVELHGVTLPEGHKGLLLFGSANRDERRWTEPDRFDIGRNPAGHLAFGHGIHHCLGAALARLEGRIVLEELVGRTCEWQITEPATRWASAEVRGPASLQLSFAVGARF
jgi:hypothetical protein